jgi:hypothetical protein
VSGKRSQKKQQKRQAEAEADLRESLAGADLGRLDRLLRSLRRSGPPRPLAILGQAVLDLAAGRLDEARSALGTLAGGEIPGVPSPLLGDLAALARGEPGRPRKGDAYLRAAAELFAALKALEAEAFAPSAAEQKALARRLRTLRDLALAGKLELRHLLDDADRRLALLADLAALETQLSRLPAEDEARTRQALLAWIRRTGPALGAALGSPISPLLAPLQHAVGTRWRSILERLAARQGAPGLAALWSADPRLLAHHVELRGGSPEISRQRDRAQQLLARRRFVELAELLRSRSRTASTAADAADLAALWSLELWARSRWDDEEGGDEELRPALSESYPHGTLVRLAEMAAEIGRRIPAEQRAGVARVLAGELFDLCDGGFCDHTAAAALSLLEQQPGDAVGADLLLAGLAGALEGRALRSLQALSAQLDRRGRGTAELSDVARRLLARIAREDPPILAQILKAVRALFADAAWPQVTELVAREMGGPFAEVLEEASFTALGDQAAGARAVSAVREQLGLLRPALGETLGFAAVELIVAGWPNAIEPRLARFFAAFPGWEPPLAVLRVLAKAMGPPWSPSSLDRPAGLLARAVIDRLDDRWPLWCPGIPTLAFTADPDDLDRLEDRVLALLAAPEVPGERREDLAAGLQAIQQIGALRHGFGRARRRAKRRPKKKPRRRSADAPQLDLGFP